MEFRDLTEGKTLRETLDETSGMTSQVVVDWAQQSRGAGLRPRIVVSSAGEEESKDFELSVGAVLSIENGQQVRPGDVLARIPRDSVTNTDITGGLPRVAELFEARKPKDHWVIAEERWQGGLWQGLQEQAASLRQVRGRSRIREYLLPKGKHIVVNDGDEVRRGDILIDGSPVPHDILRVLGTEALANYLIDEIQGVYRLQGVRIDDKHIEVICQQMLQKVEISAPGDTMFLIGEQVDKNEFEDANARLREQNGKDEDAAEPALEEAAATPVLQGITKASLQTGSFVSAASFQETTRVLTEAAVTGKRDTLSGLKENVIVGRLIPAGTGRVTQRLRTIEEMNRPRLPVEDEDIPDAGHLSLESDVPHLVAE